MILLKLITLAAVFIGVISVFQQPVKGNTLLDVIHEKQRIIEDLASAAENAYSRGCYLNCTSCVLSACGSLLPSEHTALLIMVASIQIMDFVTINAQCATCETLYKQYSYIWTRRN